MKKVLIFWVLFAAHCLAQTATVTWTSVDQTMQGFGAYGAFAPMGSTYQNLFFNTLGYSLLRESVPMGNTDCSTVNSTCATGGTQGNPFIAADAEACVADGCKVWASVSSPPASMKTNGSLNCTTTSATLISGDYGTFATYLSNFIASVQTYDSVPLYAISPQNEPDTCINGVEPTSAFSGMTGSQLDTFIKSNLGPTMTSAGQTSTLIAMPETGSYGDLTTYGNTCMADGSCSSYVGLTNFHDYDNASSPTNPYSTSKYWETEVSAPPPPPGVPNSTWDPSINDALYWSQMVHTNLVNGVTAWHYFWYVDPLSENTNSALVNPSQSTAIALRAYAIAQWAKFVRPGWMRIAATANPVSGVDVTAFKAPSGGNFAIVAVNTNGSNENVTFSLSGFSSSTVTPVITSSTQQLATLSPVSAGSSFSYTLPASSIMTFTGTNGGGSSNCPAGTNYVNPANPTGSLVTLASLGVTSCYFISSSSGSDSSNGTSESTPWQHAPGMPTAGGNVTATFPFGVTTSGASDGFIFKGGDTWTSANFQMTWTWYGASGSPVYLGVDPDWPAGPWTRPVFSCGGANCAGGIGPVGGNSFFTDFCNGTYPSNCMEYVNIDNIEWTGLYCSVSCSGSSPVSYMQIQGSNDVFTRNYMHGWSHAAWTGSGPYDGAYAFNVTDSSSSSGGLNDNLYFNVVDGSDTTEDMLAATAGDAGNEVAYNVFQNMTNEIQGSVNNLHDNFFGPIEPCFVPSGCHQNMAFVFGPLSTSTPEIYNNVFTGSTCASCGGFSKIWLGGLSCTAWTMYAFNNVLFDNAPGNYINPPGQVGGCTTPRTANFFNNTVECGTDASQNTCFSDAGDVGESDVGTVNFINNHWITSTTPVSCGVLNCPQTTNLTQTVTTANSQGYTSSQAYAFSPINSSGGTVGTGTNEQSLCAAIAGFDARGAAACKNDTTYSLIYNTTNHTVSWPDRTTTSRPGSPTPFDIGSYQFSGGSGTPIANVSPSSLAFGNQTVSTTSGPQTVTVSNTGTASLIFTGYGLTTGTQYAIYSNTCSSTYGNTLPAGQTCAIQITFTPTGTGSKTDTLTITNNSGGTPGSQQTVSLSGTGVTGVTWTVNQHISNFTCSWVTAGTTHSCSVTATVTAGHTLILASAIWSYGGTATFNSATGDTFTHCSSCYSLGTQSPKAFSTDAAYILSATGGSSVTYTYTWNTTSTSGQIDVDLIDVTVSTGTVAFDAAGAAGYTSCTCTSPTISLSGTSDYVLQILGIRGTITAPGAPYTSPSDIDNSNVFGAFVGAVNQSSVTPITWSTDPTNYPATSAIAFKQAGSPPPQVVNVTVTVNQ